MKKEVVVSPRLKEIPVSAILSVFAAPETERYDFRLLN
jgi:hypothetical protein